mmetsp:Transcript_36086/g.103620  ORF Transcript_36086/g.103620 Transcript_36086/m.103620 type:complete len:299 (-) Transcript_36086:699-1595(-)
MPLSADDTSHWRSTVSEEVWDGGGTSPHMPSPNSGPSAIPESNMSQRSSPILENGQGVGKRAGGHVCGGHGQHDGHHHSRGRGGGGKQKDQQHRSMNLQAAYIHALGDLLQSLGVLIAALCIWYNPGWHLADPLCTFIFSIFVMWTTFGIIKEATNVLMEGTPEGIDLEDLQSDLSAIPGVVEVHDLHVWSLSIGHPALAVHIVTAEEPLAREILTTATEICQSSYNILHTTIQVDFSMGKSECGTSAHRKCHDLLNGSAATATPPVDPPLPRSHSDSRATVPHCCSHNHKHGADHKV